MLSYLINRVRLALTGLLERDPVRVAAWATAAVLALAQTFNIVLDEQGVGELIAEIVLIVSGGEAARQKAVSPATHNRATRGHKRSRG